MPGFTNTESISFGRTMFGGCPHNTEAHARTSHKVRVIMNALSLMRHRNRVRDVFGHFATGLSRPVPDAAAEGGDVDHGGIRRVRNYAVAPFESVAADALPGGACIVGAPGCGVEAASVDRLGILRVHRHVVDVLRLLEDGVPGGAG